MLNFKLKILDYTIAIGLIITLIVTINISSISKKSSIDIKLEDRITLGQNWGSLIFYQYFVAKNTGNTQNEITKIKGLLRLKNSKIVVKRFDIFALNINDVSTPFINIILNPNDYFSCYLYLGNKNTILEDEKILSFENKIYEYLDSLYYSQPAKGSFEVSEKEFSNCISFMNSRFLNIHDDEYEFIIQIFSDYQENPIKQECYSLVITEPDIVRLKKSFRNIKKGKGIYLNANTFNNPLSNISKQLKNIDSKVKIIELENQIEQ
jgi:hypothetical protein